MWFEWRFIYLQVDSIRIFVGMYTCMNMIKLRQFWLIVSVWCHNFEHRKYHRLRLYHCWVVLQVDIGLRLFKFTFEIAALVVVESVLIGTGNISKFRNVSFRTWFQIVQSILITRSRYWFIETWFPFSNGTSWKTRLICL